MTVYVDQLPEEGWGKWDGGAHMLGTDLDELHEMARHIGLKREWFQSEASFAHYDLTRAYRARALAAGATEMGRIPNDVLIRNADGSYESRNVRLVRRALKV